MFNIYPFTFLIDFSYTQYMDYSFHISTVKNIIIL
jgi:hypothetical protein